MTIPARSTKWVEIEGPETLNGDYVIEPNTQNNIRYGLNTCPSISTFRDGKSGTFLSNISYIQREFPSGLNIGRRELDEDEDLYYKENPNDEIVLTLNKGLT